MSALTDTGCKPQAHGQSDPGGGACSRCGRPRCCATAKTRHGERCRKNPHPGATICTNHGLTEAGRAKAAEKRADEQAEQALGKLWPDLETVVPTRDPVASLARLSGALRQMCDQVGARVNELNRVGGGEHLQLLRAEVVLLDKLLDKAMRVDGKLADLGLMEREVRVTEQLGALLAGGVRSILEQLDLSPEQQETARVVVPAELRRLAGVAGAGEVVAGEVSA